MNNESQPALTAGGRPWCHACQEADLHDSGPISKNVLDGGHRVLRADTLYPIAVFTDLLLIVHDYSILCIYAHFELLCD